MLGYAGQAGKHSRVLTAGGALCRLHGQEQLRQSEDEEKNNNNNKKNPAKMTQRGSAVFPGLCTVGRDAPHTVTWIMCYLR